MVGSLNVQQVSTSQQDKEDAINTATLDLDEALTEAHTVDLTSGNVTIAQNDHEHNIYFFLDNATTAGRIVTVRNQKRLNVYHSDAANTQMVIIRRGSTDIEILPGQTKLVYTDGTTNGMFEMSIGLEDISWFEHATPAVSDMIYQKVFHTPCVIDDELLNSRAYAVTAPSGGAVAFDVQKNGSSIGSISFADASNTATFSTTGTAAEKFAAGDRISIHTPGTLHSIADISFNLLAQRSV